MAIRTSGRQHVITGVCRRQECDNLDAQYQGGADVRIQAAERGNVLDTRLRGKTILVTGAARRIGRALALASARAGADVIVHYSHSGKAAEETRSEITAIGCRSWCLQADFREQAQVIRLAEQAAKIGRLDAIVNNAAIFQPLSMQESSLEAWEEHLAVNLTAPFVLCQAFARQVPAGGSGRIVNILDWRALRPGADHFPYTVTKAALAAMTRSMGVALAPNLSVNGLALGAILPPADHEADPSIISQVPAGRWGTLEEVEESLLWLLTAPEYMTGEIIHLDGGRHLI
jgi:NAD(P)-dependent dehydrogenase (short-subunit alcohol dehydrogenase family)